MAGTLLPFFMNYGKGAIKTPKEVRDNHFRLGATPSLIDWSTPYVVPATFHQRDQKSSSSCTAQATGYYTEVLNLLENSKDENHSNRYVYSQTFLPGGGAYIWKAMSIPLKGTASATSVPDGDSLEPTMEDATLNPSAIIEARADKYAMIPRSNIDQMAQIVRDYHGFVTGFNGHDGMFAPNGTVIDWSKSEWGHAVYVCGYEIRNGKKCLKFKNSWTANWGDGGFGYFPEDFVNSGMMFDCYVYADIADLGNYMTEEEVKNLYALAFYRLPDATELAYWKGKSLGVFLKVAIKDRANFLSQQ